MTTAPVDPEPPFVPLPIPPPAEKPTWTTVTFWITIVSYVMPVVAVVWHHDLSSLSQSFAFVAAGIATAVFMVVNHFRHTQHLLAVSDFNRTQLAYAVTHHRLSLEHTDLVDHLRAARQN